MLIITVIIQYYFAFNSDWLFACYFVIIFSLVATAVCYSTILVSVTRRLTDKSESMLCTRTHDWHV